MVLFFSFYKKKMEDSQFDKRPGSMSTGPDNAEKYSCKRGNFYSNTVTGFDEISTAAVLNCKSALRNNFFGTIPINKSLKARADKHSMLIYSTLMFSKIFCSFAGLIFMGFVHYTRRAQKCTLRLYLQPDKCPYACVSGSTIIFSSCH